MNSQEKSQEVPDIQEPPITIILDSPIKLTESEMVTEIVIERKPTAKDFRHLKIPVYSSIAALEAAKAKGVTEYGLGDVLQVAKGICNQPGSVIDSLSFNDVNQLVQVVIPFMT